MAVKGDGCNGGGGIGANAGQLQKAFFGIGEPAAIFIGNNLGAFVQVACACIISQTLPGMQNFIEIGIGKIGYGRPALQECCEIGTNRNHGGLLQHDFAKPDAVRVLCVARFGTPWKGAMMTVIPVQHGPTEVMDFVVGEMHGVPVLCCGDENG